MQTIIRTDASTQIGTGHVMRCLTLAGALRERGAECRFICREHPGNLMELIRQQGFEVVSLPVQNDVILKSISLDTQSLPHAAWLGTDWYTDAEETKAGICDMNADWLIVDHYALDARWESNLRSYCNKIMVIDDLADKFHNCDILVDQNYSNSLHALYRNLVPTHCDVLAGSAFALVRPEFRDMRDAALSKRTGKIHRVLVAMGGSDSTNETCKVLHGFNNSNLTGLWVDIVIGSTNPHRSNVETLCGHLPNATLHIQTSRMAELMTAADCAICSGGSITWERCVLGLPAIVTILSKNQEAIAEAVARVGGHLLLGWYDRLTSADYVRALSSLTPDTMRRMSDIATNICDGLGADRVAARLQS